MIHQTFSLACQRVSDRVAAIGNGGFQTELDNSSPDADVLTEFETKSVRGNAGRRIGNVGGGENGGSREMQRAAEKPQLKLL